MSELIVKRNPELIERKVLEQIRAEIEAIEPKSHVQYGMRYADTTLMIPFHKVMQIIDKYAEQKPSEAIQGSTYGGVSWGGTYKPQEPNSDIRLNRVKNELNQDKNELEPKWIPVSEKLPQNGTYLVTVRSMVGVPRIDIRSFAKDLNKVDEFDFPKHKCGWYDYDSEYGYWEDTEVIAWMPLPEPYKVEQESEDK